MQGWMDRLAEALAEETLTAEETDRLLTASRDVAHRVERKLTPLSMFLLGSAVGRAEAGGATRDEALARALGTLDRLLPDEGPEG